MQCLKNYGYEDISKYTNGITYYNDEDDEISFTNYEDIVKVIEISKFCGYITMQELKAINEKVKELGWEE